MKYSLHFRGYILIFKCIFLPRAGEPANFLAAPAWLFFQAAPAPDFFPERLRLLIFFSSGSGAKNTRLRQAPTGSVSKEPKTPGSGSPALSKRIKITKKEIKMFVNLIAWSSNSLLVFSVFGISYMWTRIRSIDSPREEQILILILILILIHPKSEIFFDFFIYFVLLFYYHFKSESQSVSLDLRFPNLKNNLIYRLFISL